MRFLLGGAGQGVDLAAAGLLGRLSALDGVEGAALVPGGLAVSVVKRATANWRELGPRVIGLIEGVLVEVRSGARPWLASETASAPAVSDLELMARALRVFEADVQPYVAVHGGELELVDVRGGRALVRFGGACDGCPGASVTLREHVAACLRRSVPEIAGIDVA